MYIKVLMTGICLEIWINKKTIEVEKPELLKLVGFVRMISSTCKLLKCWQVIYERELNKLKWRLRGAIKTPLNGEGMNSP